MQGYVVYGGLFAFSDEVKNFLLVFSHIFRDKRKLFGQRFSVLSLFPVHEVGQIFSIAYKVSAVCFYQIVASGRKMLIYGAGEGTYISVVGVGNFCGDQGSPLECSFYDYGNIG